MQSMFLMFSNVKFKDKVNLHGIGLGLTICKRIVDALNGHITCKSSEDGTKFKVDIPVEFPEEKENPSSCRSEEMRPQNTYPSVELFTSEMVYAQPRFISDIEDVCPLYSILIVDDDAFN